MCFQGSFEEVIIPYVKEKYTYQRNISCDCRHRISRTNFYKIRSMGVHEKRFVPRRCLPHAVAIATKRFRAFLDLYEAIAQSYIRSKLERHICKIWKRNAYRVRMLCSGIKMKLKQSSLIGKLYSTRSKSFRFLSKLAGIQGMGGSECSSGYNTKASNTCVYSK